MNDESEKGIRRIFKEMGKENHLRREAEKRISLLWSLTTDKKLAMFLESSGFWEFKIWTCECIFMSLSSGWDFFIVFSSGISVHEFYFCVECLNLIVYIIGNLSR